MQYDSKELKDVKKKLEEHFGSRDNMLMFMLVTLSQTGQPCDVTFYDRKPLLDVEVGPSLFSALAYGAGAKKLAEMFNHLKFSDGTIVRVGEIWTVNPMPKGGFSTEQLAAVDMEEAEERIGPNGETLREMIRATYHCGSVDEEDRYIRRFIAS